MVAAVDDNPVQRKGIALTISIVLHALILLFFLLYKIITPIPPFPDTEAIGGGGNLELSLGTSEFGMGDNSASETPAVASAPAPAPTPEVSHDEPLLTGVDESNVAVKDEPKPKTPKEKTPKPKTPEKPKVPTVSTGLSTALNAWNTPGTGSSGKGSSTTPGTAGGATGTANGTGIGTGPGPYAGPGYTIDLANRSVRKKPVINDKPNVGGKVVMDIWVDPDGKVTRVNQNTSLSTTLDQTLVSIAKRAALESAFYPDPKARDDQKGTMTFIFTLQ